MRPFYKYNHLKIAKKEFIYLDKMLEGIVEEAMLSHLNLKFGQKVRVKSLEEDAILTVIGVSSRGLQDSYILEYPEGMTKMSYESFGQDPIPCKAIVLNEGLIEPVSNAENFIVNS